MANTDLVKKKPVALEVATYERLSKLAAQLRIDSPGGSFVSMSTAVGVLLDHWENRNGFVIRHKENHSYFLIDAKYAATPGARFTFRQSEAFVFDTKFEAEDFGFVHSDWLQEFEVAPFEPKNEMK